MLVDFLVATFIVPASFGFLTGKAGDGLVATASLDLSVFHHGSPDETHHIEWCTTHSISNLSSPISSDGLSSFGAPFPDVEHASYSGLGARLQPELDGSRCSDGPFGHLRPDAALDLEHNISGLIGWNVSRDPDGRNEGDSYQWIRPLSSPSATSLVPWSESSARELGPSHAPVVHAAHDACEYWMEGLLYEIAIYCGLNTTHDDPFGHARKSDRARRRAYRGVTAEWDSTGACGSDAAWWRIDQWWVDWTVLYEHMCFGSYRTIMFLVCSLRYGVHGHGTFSDALDDMLSTYHTDRVPRRLVTSRQRRPSLRGCVQSFLAAHLFIVAAGVSSVGVGHALYVAPFQTVTATFTALTVTAWLPYVVFAVVLAVLLTRIFVCIAGALVLAVTRRVLNVLFSPATALALVIARVVAITAWCSASVLNSSLVFIRKHGVAVYLYLSGRTDDEGERADRAHRAVALAERAHAARVKVEALGVVADVLETGLKSADDVTAETAHGFHTVGEMIGFNQHVDRLVGVSEGHRLAAVRLWCCGHQFPHDVLREAIGWHTTTTPAPPVSPPPKSWADRSDESDDDSYDSDDLPDLASAFPSGLLTAKVSPDVVPTAAAPKVSSCRRALAACCSACERVRLVVARVRCFAIRTYLATLEFACRLLASAMHRWLSVVPGVIDRLLGLTTRVALDASRRYVSLQCRYRRYSSSDYQLDFAAHVTRAATSLTTVTHVAAFLFVLLRLKCVHAAGDSDMPSSMPPLFDGTAGSFMPWLMKLGAWVAWRLSKASPILAETEPLPTASHGDRPDVVAPTLDTDGKTVTNAADVAENQRLITAWDEAQAEHLEKVDDWNDRNLKLYGAVCMAVPDWLRTSIYNDCQNDGLAAILFLRRQFDANDDNDHASFMAKIQASYVDVRSDISEMDLRHQFDSMMVARAGIIRTKNAPPPDSALKAMFDNALPASYTTIRQLVRREKHGTFIEHYSDYVGQVRAELSSRRPNVSAFNAASSGDPAAHASFIPAPPSGGRGRAGGRGRGRGGARGGGRGGAESDGSVVKFCFRCLLETCGGRNVCQKAPVQCTHCGADHHSSICPKGPGGKRRDQLTAGALSFLRRDVRLAPTAAAASATAAAAAAPAAPAAATAPAAPTYAAAAAAAPIDAAALAQAQAAAATAAAAHSDPSQSGAAYTAAMRSMGFGMMCRLPGGPCASAASLLPAGTALPDGATLAAAHVDTMATLWVLNDRRFFHRVTDPKPGFSLETAQGMCPVELVGDVFVHLRCEDGTWRAFEVRNVLYIPECPANLYSTRAMRDAFGFHHDVDGGTITLPSSGDVPAGTVRVTDDGRAFSIPICFSLKQPRDFAHWPFDGAADLAMLAVTAAFSAGVSGTTQATLYHRLGFPHDASWRHVAAATDGHGLPPSTVLSSTIPVSEAVMRGRERAAQWVRKPLADVTQPPPGAVLYADFCGPMVASHPHRFTCYCGYVDAGSGYGRVFPAHGMTAAVAIASLELFIADLAAKMGLGAAFKPSVVRSDQGAAFVAHNFQEFLSERQIQQSLAAVYTPPQNSHIERFWGSSFGTARVLLAAANLPPTFHPFALQTAAWLSNRLPRPSRGNNSPYFLLSRMLPLLTHLYAFGCLCAVALHRAWREGDKHFADRGEPALYMGPSESSPASVVYLLSSRRVATVPHVRVWEDSFPGIKGMWYKWFPGAVRDAPSDAVSADADAPSTPVTSTPEAPEAAPASGAAPSPSAVDPAPTPSPSSQPSPSQEGLRPQAPPSTPRSDVPLGKRCKPPEQWPQAASDAPPPTPMRQPDLSVESNVTQRPGHDDPSSLHYERRRSSRARSQSEQPNVTSFRGKSYGRSGLLAAGSAEHVSRAVATAVYSMVALSVVTGAPAAPGLALPAFAYASCVHGIDGAFGEYDAARDSDCLLHAFTAAADVHAYVVTLTAEFGGIDIPRSYRQALASKHADYWRDAIAKELGGLLKLGTWEMMLCSDLPKGANVMRCHFVFTVKRLADGSVEKFKARLVCDGNTQKPGVDFDRIFSTVVKSQTIRAVLIYACSRQLNLTSIDVRQAYCRGDADRDLFMSPPPGVPSRDSQGRQLCCRLLRSLYGLKQAGRIWSTLFSEWLVSWGMVRSPLDVCLYTYSSGKSILLALVYVDDVLIADNDTDLRARFVKDVAARFPIEDKGDLRWFLGIAIERDIAARTLRLSQELYIADVVTKYGDWLRAGFGRKFDSPMAEGTVLSAADSPKVDSAEHADMASRRDVYMQIVGAFSWLANMTMPHLCYATSQLSRFLANPGMPHFDAAMRVLAFIDGIADPALVFTPNASRGLEIFVDSNWGSKFSCSGAIFMLYGCPFHWFAKSQKSVSLSSAEAEFFGAMLAARDGVFARDLLFELGVISPGPTVIYSDSKSAVDLAFDPVAFKNTKHILRAANFLRDLVAREVFVVEHVPGVTMLADLLTKAVSRPVFLNLMRLLANYAATGEASLSAKPARASS